MSRPENRTTAVQKIYSYLISGKYAKNISLEKLKGYLSEGIKVFLFGASLSENVLEDMKKKYPYLLYYKHKDNTPDLFVKNGQAEDAEMLKRLYSIYLEFNYDQYLVEHEALDKTIVVRASAGTGKTTVMIDRIMYLLTACEGIEPRDICMITFTNEAANSMRGKLQKKLVEFYKATHSFKYLEIMEKMADMDISTIDGFFNKVIKSEGALLGYGQSVAIRSFVYEKKQIIRKVVDELFAKYKNKDYLKTFVLPINSYVDIAFNCWNVLSNRGYYLDDIERMDFGTAGDEKSRIINSNLKEILKRAAKEYQAMKMQKNSFAVSDIKEDMSRLADSRKNLKLRPYKYIFVDEFQDTDDSQIKSIAWLVTAMQAQLFVVGDVKQSIYRFRGAVETAFEKLLKIFPDSYNRALVTNYRTKNNILAEFNRLFRSWNRDGIKRLPWDRDVYSLKPDDGNIVKVDCRSKEERAALTASYIRSSRNSHTAVLVRTNKQVGEMLQLCRSERIPCRAVSEGGFFASKPVQDVLFLFGALLRPDDTGSMYNYLCGSFSWGRPEHAVISAFNGDEDEVLKYLNKTAEKNCWQEFSAKADKTPVFELLRNAIETYKPVANYRITDCALLEERGFNGKDLETQLDIDTEFYKLNLNKLIEHLSNIFSSEFASLLDVYDYLQNKVSTDRSEDAVYPEDYGTEENIVDIMTVHKAKGLEFGTVILPYLDKPFYYDLDRLDGARDFLTYEDEGVLKLGWYAGAYGGPLQNEYHNEALANEQEAAVREELRILYVALTRTEDELIYIMPGWKRKDTNCWAYYMKELSERSLR